MFLNRSPLRPPDLLFRCVGAVGGRPGISPGNTTSASCVVEARSRARSAATVELVRIIETVPLAPRVGGGGGGRRGSNVARPAKGLAARGEPTSGGGLPGGGGVGGCSSEALGVPIGCSFPPEALDMTDGIVESAGTRDRASCACEVMLEAPWSHSASEQNTNINCMLICRPKLHLLHRRKRRPGHAG